MKTFFILFFLVPVFLYVQAAWTPRIEIEEITVNEYDKITSYSDANGNHLVINSNGTITYYRLNIEGELETNVPIDNGCEYSNYTVAITAYEDELYIAYQKGTFIKVVKSTDSGNSWNYLTSTVIDNNICNGIDAVYNDRGLHVVWAIKRDTDDFFETWYERYKRVEPQLWEARYNITNETNSELGGRPTIALSENRIHVNYNIYSGYEINPFYYLYLGVIDASRTRDYNFTTSAWEPSQLVYISEPILIFPCELDFYSSSAEKIIVFNGYLHVISFVWVFPHPPTCILIESFIYDKRRPLNSSNWESEIKIGVSDGEDMPVAAITGQKLNIVTPWPSQDYIHYQYSDNIWSEYNYIYLGGFEAYIRNFCLSAYSQTLYTFWIDSGNQLWYSQSDQNPVIPLELNPFLDKQHDFFKYEPEVLSKFKNREISNSSEKEGK